MSRVKLTEAEAETLADVRHDLEADFSDDPAFGGIIARHADLAPRFMRTYLDTGASIERAAKLAWIDIARLA